MRTFARCSRVSLSKEKQVNIVISHKKKIVELTNKILEILHKPANTKRFSEEQRLSIKQLTNEVVSELAIIASFCGSRERDWAFRMSDSVARLNVILDWVFTSLVEFWCTMANSITLDFNKTPFRFFSADFKLKWHEFETRLKGLVDRREQRDSNARAN